MADFAGAIDQGTTSTRFIIFGRNGAIKSMAQREHRQIFPAPGHVEHDAMEIWSNTKLVMREALDQAGLAPRDLATVGITNQRETVLIWDRHTGKPLHNALVWQDTRVAGEVARLVRGGGRDRFREITGLPLASYFSGLKLAWLLDHGTSARARAASGDLLAGTIDTWLYWNLSGGAQGGRHVTDVTNASRTQLMDLRTLAWDQGMLDRLRIPAEVLPQIVPSIAVLGDIRDPFEGVPLGGILGDQQAALFGQACFAPGDAKNTYGTGCFVLMNTGGTPVPSKAGLITTLAYQRAGENPVYALEGSIAITGALVQWLRDNLGIIQDSSGIETLARSVETNGDVYLVPAFSGLYAPHWDETARGVITGLTRYANKGHIARAALEATAYQTRDVLVAMEQDSGMPVPELRCDGGMAQNEFLMQFQSDILDRPVLRPRVTETTALGAAYAAGLATGFWRSLDEIKAHWHVEKQWTPAMAAGQRAALTCSWDKAVKRAFGWVDGSDPPSL